MTLFKMKNFLTIKVLLCSISWVSSTIDGLTYMDPLNFGPYKNVQGVDACNPLYWYPKSMPDYCYQDKIPNRIVPLAPPPPMPMSPLTPPTPPVLQQPYPVPMPPMPPLIMPPLLMPQPLLPAPMMPVPIPYPQSPMLSISGIPYPPPLPYQPHQQIGFLPGLPGIVSDDGGINILPFSDAYADLLEKHKQKMIRRKYLKILGDYETYPWKSRRTSRCH